MRRDVTRFKKTYSFYRQEGRVVSLTTAGLPPTQDSTRFRKSYSFVRQQPRLSEVEEIFILTEGYDIMTTESGDEFIP